MSRIRMDVDMTHKYDTMSLHMDKTTYMPIQEFDFWEGPQKKVQKRRVHRDNKRDVGTDVCMQTHAQY